VTNPVAARRLAAQHLARPAKLSVSQLVERMVAVQAQDFTGAKWALGLRLIGVDDAEVLRAYDAGEILRTHVLRPTWHFVAPADIRALLRLTAPRVMRQNQSMGRKLGLTEALLARSNDAIVAALEGGTHLTRDGVRAALHRVRIDTEGPQRMTYLMMHAELSGLICSGPRLGNQFSYALLDERVPSHLDPQLDNEAFLLVLGERYLRSRGPSTDRDFAWWAGLTLRDARKAFDALRSQVRRIRHDEIDYWELDEPRPRLARSPAAMLLSIYDEYISSYRSRGVIVSPDDGARLIGKGNALAWVLVLDGRIAGTWRRVVERGGIRVELEPFRVLSNTERAAVEMSVTRYASFLNSEVVLDIPGGKA
jgi:hypothetical protein